MNTATKLTLKTFHFGRPTSYTIHGSKYYIWRNWDIVIDGISFSVERKRIIEKKYSRVQDYLCFVPHDPITMPDGDIAFCNGGRNFHFVDTTELSNKTAQKIFEICKASLLRDYENKSGRWYRGPSEC